MTGRYMNERAGSVVPLLDREVGEEGLVGRLVTHFALVRPSANWSVVVCVRSR